MTDRLIDALKPILSRVRRDVSAVKVADGSSRWTNDPLTKERLRQHLTGGPARGVCPIQTGESTTRLALFDLDSHKGQTPWDEMCTVTQGLLDALTLDGYRGIPFRSSGGNGLHIYVLWDEPQDAYCVRQAMFGVLSTVGLKSGAGGIAKGQVEVFPKQDEVAVGEYGNQFILPLAGKSEPLDELLGLTPMGREWVTQVDWSTSEPVPKLERPTVEARGAGGGDNLERVRNALFSIPNDSEANGPDYDQWRDLAFAVHEATGGSEDGFELFSEWSAQNPKHEQKFFADRVWPYIKGGEGRGRAITRATLYAQAERSGWQDTTGVNADGFDDVPVEVIEQAAAAVEQAREVRSLEKYEAKAAWKKAIAESPDDFQLREKVCHGISKDKRLSDVDRAALAEMLKERFLSLGEKLPIAACRQLVAPVRLTAERKTPGWCENYVYETDSDQFVHLETDERLTMQAFNARYNRFVANDEGEVSKSASWIALEDVQIETVTRSLYLPWADRLFETCGVKYVNSFKPSSLPKTAEAFTAGGKNAINLIRRHLNIIAGGRTDVVQIILSWMAHQVQKPGVKVRWAPLIKGIEGDGKTVIGRIMVAALGQANVKDISPKVLGTDFTGWAHGACVGVLEEIKLTGHNRHDILNALKPYVTNNSVPVHAKGKDEYNVVNTMNYIAFTNHSDALPIGDTDRRWFIVFTPFTDREQLLESLGGDAGAYFDALFDAIECFGSEIRKWFLDFPIPESFKPNGSAPATDEKKSMISMGLSDEEDAVIAALEAGGLGIGKNVIVTSYLTRAVREINPEIEVKWYSVAKVLMKMGWVKVPYLIKWRGEPRRTWVKGVAVGTASVTNGFLRCYLDETLAHDDVSDLFG